MRRADSEILGAILLILVAVIASIVFYHYIMGIVTQPANARAERSIIVVEAVKQEGSTLIAYIRNAGNLQVTIDSAYLLDYSTRTAVKSYSLSVDVPPREIKEIILDIAGTPSGLYVVKFVTDIGSSISFTTYIS